MAKVLISSTPEQINIGLQPFILEDNYDSEEYKFISLTVPLDKDSILFFPAKGDFENEINLANMKAIIDLRIINSIKDINEYFISINKLLPDSGIFLSRFESYYNRKMRLFSFFGKNMGRVIWILDFVFNRVLPKLALTKKLYNYLRGGCFKVISLAETLGRAVFCGFEILGFKSISNLTYFAVRKTGVPCLERYHSVGPLFRMKRVGKGGSIIGVYKLRTMHPYSEYLQSYILKLNGYNECGKIKNDFRVTGWSKVIRKLYLDEIPQLINVIKGDMNLVGVRPLSIVSFNLLPEDLKQERIKYKPGCIPPYVALRKKGLDGVLESERIYLKEMEINPLRTNLKYFFLAVFNLLSFRISSK